MTVQFWLSFSGVRFSFFARSFQVRIFISLPPLPAFQDSRMASAPMQCTTYKGDGLEIVINMSDFDHDHSERQEGTILATQ